MTPAASRAHAMQTAALGASAHTGTAPGWLGGGEDGQAGRMLCSRCTQRSSIPLRCRKSWRRLQAVMRISCIDGTKVCAEWLLLRGSSLASPARSSRALKDSGTMTPSACCRMMLLGKAGGQQHLARTAMGRRGS